VIGGIASAALIGVGIALMCTAVGSPAGAIMTGVGLSILAPSVMSGIKGYKLS
jgi:hypothetical protein